MTTIFFSSCEVITQIILEMLSKTYNELTSIKNKIDQLLRRKLESNDVNSNSSSTFFELFSIKQGVDKFLDRKLETKTDILNDSPTIDEKNQTIFEIILVKNRVDNILFNMLHTKGQEAQGLTTIEGQKRIIPDNSHLDSEAQQEAVENIFPSSEKIGDIIKAILRIHDDSSAIEVITLVKKQLKKPENSNPTSNEFILIRKLLDMLENYLKLSFSPTIKEIISIKKILDMLEIFNVSQNGSVNEGINLLREIFDPSNIDVITIIKKVVEYTYRTIMEF